ncbi:MAG TPA: hypothetical protein VF915_04300, partial [Reyranella sp.]
SSAPHELEMAHLDLASRRAEARAEALRGEHQIYLSMAAGPGSLAEALNDLASSRPQTPSH